MIEKDPRTGRTGGRPETGAAHGEGPDARPEGTDVGEPTEDFRPVIEPVPLTRKKRLERPAEAGRDGDETGEPDEAPTEPPAPEARTTALATIPVRDEPGDGEEPDGEAADDADTEASREEYAEPAPERPKAPIGLILTIAGVAAACIIAGFALGMIASANVTAKTQGAISATPSADGYAQTPAMESAAPGASGSATTRSDASSSAAQHEHVWVETFETVETPRVTHTVEHPAEYSTVTREDTYCNVCGEIITGKAEEHRAETGHDRWTAGVAHQVEVLTREAWTEEVVDSEASTQRVHSGWVCETCGATRQ